MLVSTNDQFLNFAMGESSTVDSPNSMTKYFKVSPKNAVDASCNVITVEAFSDALATVSLGGGTATSSATDTCDKSLCRSTPADPDGTCCNGVTEGCDASGCFKSDGQPCCTTRRRLTSNDSFKRRQLSLDELTFTDNASDMTFTPVASGVTTIYLKASVSSGNSVIQKLELNSCDTNAGGYSLSLAY